MMNKSVANICKIAIVLCIAQSAMAGVVDNSVYPDSARINSGSELVSAILNNCYDMNCLKTNVLKYLNTFLGINEKRSARSMESVDEDIFDRVAKIIRSNEFTYELPETFFHKSLITYRGDRGFDVKVSEDAANEARKHKDDDLKKKLLLPALLLLKLKLKAILPLFVGIIGIKAMKALIISKLALGLVVGFIAYSLFKKPAAPATPEVSTLAPSSYDPSSWEPSATSGGPYARIWNDPSGQNLAYSAYYSGNSAVSSSGSGSSATSKPSSYSTL